MSRPATGATIISFALQDGWRSPERAIQFEDESANSERNGNRKSNAAVGARSLKLLRLSDLHLLGEPASLVKGLLFQGQFSTIFGPPNVGKTFFALDLALCIATGRDWHGLRCKHGLVVYVALEGARGVEKRCAAWCLHHGVNPQFLSIVIGEGAINLRERKEPMRAFIDDAIAAAKECDLPLALVVIDTLARAMDGGDENSSPDMGALIAGADEIRLRTKAHVCLIHHVGKDASRGARGHSSLHGASDTMIEIAPIKGGGEARVTKQKEAEREGRYPFTLQTVSLDRRDEDGDPVTSAVVIWSDKSVAFEDERLNARQHDGAMVLRRLVQESFSDGQCDEDTQRGVPVAISAWKTALENARWPSPREPGEKARRTPIGQRHRGGEAERGQGPDNSRAKESFEREFRRLRQHLEKIRIISIEGENVFLAKC
jgi:hypothetical protein